MIRVTVLLLDGGHASTADRAARDFRARACSGRRCAGRSRARASRSAPPRWTAGPSAATAVCASRADRALRDVRQSDLIVVPSFGLDVDGALRRFARVVPWLRRQHARGASLAGICSGRRAAGRDRAARRQARDDALGAGDRATRSAGPRSQWQADRFVTQAGRVFCAGGVYAALDLSLHLVERYAGYDVAMQTARALLVETRRTAQSGFSVPARRSDHGDAEIAAAQEWMRDHLREALRVDALARRFGMSPRSFARRFKQATGEPPLAYLHGLRVEAAKHLLERSARARCREIAAAVGYEDVAFFRALFRRRTGARPPSGAGASRGPERAARTAAQPRGAVSSGTARPAASCRGSRTARALGRWIVASGSPAKSCACRITTSLRVGLRVVDVGQHVAVVLGGVRRAPARRPAP